MFLSDLLHNLRMHVSLPFPHRTVLTLPAHAVIIIFSETEP